MTSFYNTTNERLHVLKQHEQKAQSQEATVKEIFTVEKKAMTAADVLHKYPNRNVPLTSIRRALTNLVNDGFLLKTPFKKEGLFGRNNFLYRVNTGQMTLFN